MSEKNRRILILILAGVVYLVLFPEDAQAIATLLTTMLHISNAVSPGLYALLTIVAVAVIIAKTCGGGRLRRVGSADGKVTDDQRR